MRPLTTPRILLRCLLATFLLTAACRAQEIVATPAHPTGVYGVGEKIAWTITAQAKGGPAPAQATYVVKKAGKTPVGEGTLDLSNGPATLETTLGEPGTILVEITAKAGDKEIKTFVGAAVAPDKIQPSAPRPDDFDTFWSAQIDKLAAIPANPKLEPTDAGKPNLKYFKVTLDNINGTHVYGQLARPKKAGKFPALLVVQWAGVYGLPKTNVTNRAAQGWLALNIMPHDVPFDQPADYYKTLADTTLKDYTAIGHEDRETSYFLRMVLGCHRAAEYLTTRDDWDGKTLVVTGLSQGGFQSFAAAAIHPKVTAMIVNVPAGCDPTGSWAGRAAGWPYWDRFESGEKQKKTLDVSRYYDCVNFASRIKCPALVALGLIDVTSPPTGVLAAYNQLQGPKESIVMIDSDHHGNGNAQAKFHSRSEAWLRALAKGEPPPSPAVPPAP